MRYLLLFFCLFLFIAYACKKDVDFFPDKGVNLITNSTFEAGGGPTFDGWTDDGWHTFTNEVSPTGGAWALMLEPTWFPTRGIAETSVSGYRGTMNLRLSAETRTKNWIGEIKVFQENLDGNRITLDSLMFDDSTWTNKTMDFSATVIPEDKLVVLLSAGSTEIATGQVFFDNVTLARR